MLRMNVLISIAIIIAVFLLCREIICWYWKINHAVKRLDEIERHLARIAVNYPQLPDEYAEPDNSDRGGESIVDLMTGKKNEQE